MSAINQTTAVLRLFGDDLDPAEVSRLLGAEPTRYGTKGEVLTGGPARMARTGSWFRQAAEQSPGDIDLQIVSLLGDLTSDLAVWRTLTSRFQCDIFFGLFMRESNEGTSIAAATARLLADRDLSLQFDIYDGGSERA